MDCVASLYGRNHLGGIIKAATQDIFIPLTVGGGIRSVSDVNEILRAGADKVAVNTAAVANPKLITQIANKFGRQAMVLSIEAKQIEKNQWEVYINNGRERTGLDVVEWAERGVEMGAGEILLTSVDKDGTRKGFDIGLIKAVSSIVEVPIIASGGMGVPEDLVKAVNDGGADAVAMAGILHYDRSEIGEIRSLALSSGIRVRHYDHS
jgi:cyclase